jgi:hypothetical protein
MEVVGHAYIALYHGNYPVMPSINAVAKKATVSCMYASLVIEELLCTGTLVIDPEIRKEQRIEQRLTRFHLTVEEELFLLSLWTENPK